MAETRKKRNLHRKFIHRALAGMMILCLLLSQVNLGLMVTYAINDGEVTFEIGENVTAVLENGVLTLRGMGETDDFRQETAPFTEYAEDIHALVIEDGITYIGDFLFYGLGGLKGELVLPESIIGFGDYAFSGDSLETAPGFTVIRNPFEFCEITYGEQPGSPATGSNASESLQKSQGSNVDSSQKATAAEAGRSTDAPKVRAEKTELSVPRLGTALKEAGAEGGESDVTDAGGQIQDSVSEAGGGNSSGSSISEGENTGSGTAGPEEGSGGGNGNGGTTAPEEGSGNGNGGTTAPEEGSGGGNENGGTTAPEEGSGSGNENGGTTAPEEGSGSGNGGTTAPEEGNGSGSGNGATTAPEEGSGNGNGATTLPEEENETIPDHTVNYEKPPMSDLEQLLEDELDYTVESIYQQTVEHPDTLFFPEQRGIVVCYEENAEFVEAVLAAGYQLAEGTVNVTLDDLVEAELPVADGQICLPECPEEICSLYEDEEFLSFLFSGWREDAADESAPVLKPGDYFELPEDRNLSFYSVWETIGKCSLKVKVSLQGDQASYTLIDGSTEENVEIPPGYQVTYQWQEAPKSEAANAIWTDIEGAEDPEYTKTIETADNGKRFRCGVLLVKDTQPRSARTLMAAAESAPASDQKNRILYSETVDGAGGMVNICYVKQPADAGDTAGGNDETGDGSMEKPYATINKAAERLSENTEGTAETNKIRIIGNYKLTTSDTQFLSAENVPVTIAGYLKSADTGEADPAEQGLENGTLIGISSGSEPQSLFLFNDLGFESITIKNIEHIYGNGHNIFLGYDVKNSTSFYLYGHGNHDLGPKKEGKISVYSGTIVRIVGYVRSKTLVEAEGHSVNIFVGGNATVGTIIAGSASGGVQDGDINIAVAGNAQVETLVGGNQGYLADASPYSGKTVINVVGGKVTNILGAGSGRNQSIPTYQGALQIKVSGGVVGNIYGAGSAAYVVSPEELVSTVDISVTGGTVDNIFAAGKGWDKAVTPNDDLPEQWVYGNFGSLTGTANISVSGAAVIKGSIYASGEGYEHYKWDTKNNAYLDGNVTVTVDGANVQGNVFGGGKGISADGYEDCARVSKDSKVKVQIKKGIVEGSVFGGGENGRVEGRTLVEISGGSIHGSVYGGALGVTGQWLVYGGSTVNMTGGTITGNLYGGSQLSNDGVETKEGEAYVDQDLVFVNLAGGTVGGNVFGGGYRGIVNGSTHLHIGADAPDNCEHYKAFPDENPNLSPGAMSIENSVYAGGDYGGGDSVDYSAITVAGTSHVYIDGTGYDTGDLNGPFMMISEGVFGSGASCDAGMTRRVTVKNYGHPVADQDSGMNIGATRTLTAIQRADSVVLNNSHIVLTGQSDVANPNQTALYSVNRVGNLGDKSNDGRNALILQGGSTMILESAITETANFASLDASGNPVALNAVGNMPNTVRFNSGTEFRIFYTKSDSSGGSQEIYGAVSGYAYMLAEDTADAYAYARLKQGTDGGFAGADGSELSFTSIAGKYRYWQVRGIKAVADRYTVLTAHTLNADAAGYGSDGYSVTTSTISLPFADKDSQYKVTRVTFLTETGVNLVDAAKNGLDGDWVTSEQNVSAGEAIDEEDEKNIIRSSPLDSFGLFMKAGKGFTDLSDGKVISNGSTKNSITGVTTAAIASSGIPEIEFYLTYFNDGIEASKSLGTVRIELERIAADGNNKDVVTMNVEINTKAKTLGNQTVELYATQTGSYAGRLIIPSGDSRELKLTSVSAAYSEVNSGELVAAPSGANTFSGHQFSLTVQPVKSQGWSPTDLRTEPYDLFMALDKSISPVKIGTTDSRYQAVIEFTLTNAVSFEAKADDMVTLILSDQSGTAEITLNIHWKPSVVSQILAESGRVYGEIYGGTGASAVPKISTKSAVSVEFTLESPETAELLWLELQDNESKKMSFPEKTQLTLLYDQSFYKYSVTGAEADQRIMLSDFKEMWTDNDFNAQILKDRPLTVIVDFGQTEVTFKDGDYSLRLRNDKSADSMGAGFHVDIQNVVAEISGGDGYSRGEHRFALEVKPGSDTRILDGMTAVLSPSDGKAFPEGTKFIYVEGKDIVEGSNIYYPMAGKVYVPLKASALTHTIVMDTWETAGMEVEGHKLTVEIFPSGQSAGDISQAIFVKSGYSYPVTDNPSYGLHASLKEDSSRVVTEAGAVLNFNVDYSAENTGVSSHTIQVGIQKKEAGQYEDYIPSASWTVFDSGGSSFGDGSGRREIGVTVPPNQPPGTYRLIFTLGEVKIPYNIIIQ